MMNFGGDRFGGYQSMDTSGFGGGMGGGFMEEGSPGMDSSQGGKEKKKSTTLTPCTVAMLNQAEYSQQDDIFKFEGIELHQVKVVGVIREVEESATNIVYKVNDMTGPSILVRKWLETDESQQDRTRRSECRENTYVRVYGSLKYFEDKVSIIGFHVDPLEDFDEISYHMLDTIQSYVKSKQRLQMPCSPKREITRTPSAATPISSIGIGGGGIRPSFGGSGDGVGGVEKQILNMINNSTEEEGVGVAELKQKFRNMTEHQIKKAVEFLSNEGHIYSTIDDEHFRSTAA